MIPQETEPDLPVSVQESLAEVWVDSGLLWCHYPYHSLASGQKTGREHSPAHQQKIGLMIYWAWPRPLEQDSVLPRVSLSHQEASINLLSLSSKGKRETNQTDHMDHSLVELNNTMSHAV